jgi:hypothetical protein
VTNDFETLLDAMRRAAGALRDAEVPFALAGGIAIYAAGGPDTDHDVDFLLKPSDADRALKALEDAGFKTERPPEGWLFKAFDDSGAMIDLIFQPASGEVDDEVLARAEPGEVHAIRVPVVSPTEILASKLLALGEHRVDYESVLEIARSLRERIDWDMLRHETRHSPFAKAFFTLAEELGVAA